MRRRTLCLNLDTPEGHARFNAFENKANRLMARHLGVCWHFGWMHQRRGRIHTLAKCTQIHEGKIALSGGWLLFNRIVVLWPAEEQRETILHEIAHALIWDCFGPNYQPCHGTKWRAKARELGVSPEHLAQYEGLRGSDP